MPRPVEINETYFRDRSTIGADGCWLWRLFCNPNGYGKTGAGATVYGEQQAHRLAYRVLRNDGAEITGEIDHLCRNRSCVHPDHLEMVPHRENMRRAPHNSHIAPKAAQTHCVQGHPFTGDNLGYTASTGQRYCKTCKRTRTAEYRERRHQTALSKER